MTAPTKAHSVVHTGYAMSAAPMSIRSAWSLLIAAGGLDDADNAGSRVIDPTAVDTEDAGDHYELPMKNATYVQFAVLYPRNANAVNTQLVIQAFGQDGLGVWTPLHEIDLPDHQEVEATVSPGSDTYCSFNGSDYKVGSIVTFDADRASIVRPAVKTALDIEDTGAPLADQAILIGREA